MFPRLPFCLSAAIHIVVHWRNPQNSSIITLLYLINFELIFVMLHTAMMPVTTRIIIFLGDPYVLYPSFGIGLLASGQLESEKRIIHEHPPEHIYLAISSRSGRIFGTVSIFFGMDIPFFEYMKRHVCHNFFPG